MAYSRVVKIGDGVSKQFTVNFALGVLDRSYVTAQVGTETDGTGAPAYRTITFLTDELLQLAGNAPGLGVRIVFDRTVPKDNLIINYSDGDVLDEVNLDTSQKQTMMAMHEFLDGRSTSFIDDLSLGGFRVVNVANPIDPQDVATKAYVTTVSQGFEAIPGYLAAATAAQQAANTAATALLNASTQLSTPGDNTVSMQKLADIPSKRIIGRTSAGTGDPEALTAVQVREVAQAPSFRQARYRNRIWDPGVLVSQQNGITASSDNAFYLSDGWTKATIGAGLNNSAGRALSGTPGGSPYRLRWVNGLVKSVLDAGDYDSMFHFIEGTDTADAKFGTVGAKKLTFKFGCKMPAGTWAVRFGNSDATRSYLTSFTVSAGEAGVEVYKTIEVLGDVVGSWAGYTELRDLMIMFPLVAGSAFVGVPGWQSGNMLAPPGCSNFSALPVNTIAEFFDFQLFVGLDAGEEPPPFEVESYADALRKCQRYYEVGYFYLLFTASGVEQCATSLSFKATKRTTPALGTITGTTNTANFNTGAYDNPNTNGGGFYMVSNNAGTAYCFSGFFANARM